MSSVCEQVVTHLVSRHATHDSCGFQHLNARRLHGPGIPYEFAYSADKHIHFRLGRSVDKANRAEGAGVSGGGGPTAGCVCQDEAQVDLPGLRLEAAKTNLDALLTPDASDLIADGVNFDDGYRGRADHFD
jgi:hypothetical protein